MAVVPTRDWLEYSFKKGILFDFIRVYPSMIIRSLSPPFPARSFRKRIVVFFPEAYDLLGKHTTVLEYSEYLVGDYYSV